MSKKTFKNSIIYHFSFKTLNKLCKISNRFESEDNKHASSVQLLTQLIRVSIVKCLCVSLAQQTSALFIVRVYWSTGSIIGSVHTEMVVLVFIVIHRAIYCFCTINLTPLALFELCFVYWILDLW